MSAPLLIEVLTEELPPKSLARLSAAFGDGVVGALGEQGLLDADSAAEFFATPRRLALLISQVREKQLDRMVERKGPAIASALDAAGQPTPALLGFAKSCGVDVSRLEQSEDNKGRYFVYRSRQKGAPLKDQLAAIVAASLKKLPAPKLMRWGDSDVQFVRPVHGLIMLHGAKLVPGEVLGVKSGRKTLGHRFLSQGAVSIAHAKDYARTLERAGAVIASHAHRRALIERQLNAASAKLGKAASWRVGKEDALIDEVASMVEWPAVYQGGFAPEFLGVPKECLIISMQQHQRYFALADGDRGLLPQFLFVSNIKTKTPKHIVHGNERVLRARLSDAKFFFEQDRKQRLAERVARLGSVVYHNKLGSQLERVERITKLAGEIARRLARPEVALLRPDEIQHAERAAHLCKADLLTEMVGEFPELQGIMGRYYALHDGEPAAVAQAIEQHYYPRAAGDALPASGVAASVALADKLDTLVGIYGIGLVPTGEKDPYGLRRQALGVVRILAEKKLPLDVVESMQLARGHFPPDVLAESVAQDLHGFMLERLRPYLRDQDFAADEIDAVLSLGPRRLDQVVPRLQALQAFRRLPEAAALAAANKRIRNILRQAGGAPGTHFDAALLRDDAERRLADAVRALQGEIAPLLASFRYTEALKRLATLRGAVDSFFDQVMVMVEDEALRRNRLALLNALAELFLHVADISRLQGRGESHEPGFL